MPFTTYHGTMCLLNLENLSFWSLQKHKIPSILRAAVWFAVHCTILEWWVIGIFEIFSLWFPFSKRSKWNTTKRIEQFISFIFIAVVQVIVFILFDLQRIVKHRLNQYHAIEAESTFIYITIPGNEEFLMFTFMIYTRRNFKLYQ